MIIFPFLFLIVLGNYPMLLTYSEIIILYSIRAEYTAADIMVRCVRTADTEIASRRSKTWELRQNLPTSWRDNTLVMPQSIIM